MNGSKCSNGHSQSAASLEQPQQVERLSLMGRSKITKSYKKVDVQQETKRGLYEVAREEPKVQPMNQQATSRDTILHIEVIRIHYHHSGMIRPYKCLHYGKSQFAISA